MIQAAIYGRLAFAPSEKTTKAGAPMTTVRLAIDVTRHGAEAQETLWVDVLAFGELGERLASHDKGQMISCFGRLTRGAFTTKDGIEREQWNMIAEDFISARTVRPRAGRKARPGNAETANSQRF